jgi:anti-sigma factor NepR-like protein
MKDQKPPNPPLRSEKKTAREGKTVALGRDVQAKIGQYLRAMYDDVVKEGVPEHLANLLRQVEKKPADEEPQETR